MRHAKPFVLLALLAGIVVAIAMLPGGEMLMSAVAFIQTHQPLAWIVYVLGYAIAAVLAVPGALLTLAAGFVFGLPLGVLLVSIGSVLGAACAFLVGRFVARDWIAERIEHSATFRALDLATRHEGFFIVLLARLSPLLPFNLLNYGLSLTGVRFRDYFLASLLGMLPATVVYVYLGTLAKSFAELASGDVQGDGTGVLLVIGFVSTVALTVLLTHRASRVLRMHLDREASAMEEPRSGSAE